MLNIDQHITLDAAAITASNLCDRFSDDDLARIGQECWRGWDADEQSRAHWVKRNEAGMDLALQIQKDKTFPWPNSANVAFPLVTIAAMQFHARAYPAIVQGDQIVKSVVFGDDPDGKKALRADRVGSHMSWQLLYEDKTWEEQEDKAILNLSIVGTNFKKSYFNASLGHNVSELVLAKDLTLNYWAKSVEDCNRKTHRVPKFRNEVYEAVMRGIWRDCLEEGWYTSQPVVPTTQRSANADNRQGVTPPTPDDASAFIFREQHCSMDLDGDGYAEPYIITFETQSRYVVRIVCRFDSEKAVERVAAGAHKGKILKITPTEYFTKKTFIPSPDGGIYDIGFGFFLGSLNESVNSIINMLLDAGTLQTTSGGFLGRGAKIRGGVYTIAPFEWKRVDSDGDDLRKSIVPMPINQPSPVLFQLLGLLIDYASRVAGTTDITVGENPGQNTPAQTTQTMVEMGQKIYTAIFKRIWRASKEEFAKLYKLNGIYMALDPIGVKGATRLDFIGGADLIAPVADPTVTSDTMSLQRAIMLKQNATVTPGYIKDAVEVRLLQAMRVENIDQVFKGTEGQPPIPDPKLVIAQGKEQGLMQRHQIDTQVEMQKFAAELQEEQRLNNAKIVELMAKAQANAANAQSEEQYAQVAAINAQISVAQLENNKLEKRIDTILQMAKLQSDHATKMKQLKSKSNAK
jgi:chaperonin GroES